MRLTANRQTLWRLFGFLKPWRSAYFASLLALAVVLTSERMVVAYVVKEFVDAITSSKLDLLWYSVEVWFLFLVIWIPLDVLLTYLWRSTSIRAIANLRQTL